MSCKQSFKGGRWLGLFIVIRQCIPLTWGLSWPSSFLYCIWLSRQKLFLLLLLEAEIECPFTTFLDSSWGNVPIVSTGKWTQYDNYWHSRTGSEHVRYIDYSLATLILFIRRHNLYSMRCLAGYYCRFLKDVAAMWSIYSMRRATAWKDRRKGASIENRSPT